MHLHDKAKAGAVFAKLKNTSTNAAGVCASRTVCSIAQVKALCHIFTFVLLYLSLAALHNDQLLLWRGSGEDDLRVVLQDIVELLWGQILQVTTVNDAGLGISVGKKRHSYSMF